MATEAHAKTPLSDPAEKHSSGGFEMTTHHTLGADNHPASFHSPLPQPKTCEHLEKPALALNFQPDQNNIFVPVS